MQGNIVIYATERDRDWIEMIDKVAKTKDWSRSKTIKWALREMIAGNYPEPTVSKPILKPEFKQAEAEKITAEEIFQDFEELQSEQPIIDEGSTMEEQANNCNEKELMPSGSFNCDYKNKFSVYKPYCPICWQQYDIWGEAIVKQKGR